MLKRHKFIILSVFIVSLLFLGIFIKREIERSNIFTLTKYRTIQVGNLMTIVNEHNFTVYNVKMDIVYYCFETKENETVTYDFGTLEPNVEKSRAEWTIIVEVEIFEIIDKGSPYGYLNP